MHNFFVDHCETEIEEQYVQDLFFHMNNFYMNNLLKNNIIRVVTKISSYRVNTTSRQNFYPFYFSFIFLWK